MFIIFIFQDYRVVFYPCHVSTNHWVLFVYFHKLNYLQYFDLRETWSLPHLGKFKEVLELLGMSLKGLNSGKLKRICPIDDESCGVFVCMQVVSICYGVSESEWPDWPECRRMISKALATGSFEIKKSFKVKFNLFFWFENN
jgi:hypothetical protein